MQQAGIRPEQLGAPQYTQAHFEQAVQQKQHWMAQRHFSEFEANAPKDYHELKPLMLSLIQSGRASTRRQAYERLQLRHVKQQRNPHESIPRSRRPTHH
jgi:hypothetical protein